MKRAMFLVLAVFCAGSLAFGCGDDDSGGGGGDTDTDADTDADTDVDTDADGDSCPFECTTGWSCAESGGDDHLEYSCPDSGDVCCEFDSDTGCDGVCEPCSDTPDSCCPPYECIVAPGPDLCMYFDPDYDLCPETQPDHLSGCEYPNLECLYESSYCYCSCDGWQCYSDTDSGDGGVDGG